MTDDLGVTNNYGTTDRGWAFIYGSDKGVTWIQPNVPAAEWTELNKAGGFFAMYEAGDLNFIKEFGRIMTYRVGELGKFLGDPVDAAIDRWHGPVAAGSVPLGPAYRADAGVQYWGDGFPKHHSLENGGQVGGLLNIMYNRDAQNHSWSNILSCGLPTSVIKAVADVEFERVGYPAGMSAAVNAGNAITVMNRSKAVAAKFALARKELTDCTGLCNWMWPWLVSPLKERGYRGDLSLESQLFSLATGTTFNTVDFDNEGYKFFTLQRCLTMRAYGRKDLRAFHDQLPAWGLAVNHTGAVAFDGTNYYETQADWDTALDLFYAECGYDRATGAPTRACLTALGMADVADELAALGLLPA
jgi:aldehyde:ferredoxin oxidoreductase